MKDWELAKKYGRPSKHLGNLISLSHDKLNLWVCKERRECTSTFTNDSS